MDERTRHFTIRPFAMGSNNECALKPLEEAAEVRSAWQELDACLSIGDLCNGCESDRGVRGCVFRRDLADEIADCMTACLNLAERYNLDMAAAVERCEQRNRASGRYPQEADSANQQNTGGLGEMESTFAKALGGEGALPEWKIETRYSPRPEGTQNDRLQARVAALFRVSSKLHGLVARKICRYCLDNCKECPMTEYEQLGEELLQE